MPEPSKTTPITLAPGLIRVRDEAAFGLGGLDLGTRFLSRVFTLAAVRSVTVDRVARTASIRHDASSGSLPALLVGLASALRGEGVFPSPGPLPVLPALSKFSIHRFGSTLTSWEVVLDEPGRLKVRHEGLRGDDVAADRIERGLRGLPGIRVVVPDVWTGHLLIRYDPSTFDAPGVLRLVEALAGHPGRRPSETPAATPAKFGLANFSLGVAAAGQYLMPALLPASALLLVGTNIRTFQAARLELARKRLGLPVLYSVIVGTTLLSGQFVASALMTWFFRFWHRRFRIELATERTRLIEQAAEEPILARLLTPTGAEVLVAVGRLQVGDQILVASGETVPADVRVFEGEGVVDERGVRGLEGISRKRPGDHLLAGSTVLAGSMKVEVVRLGDRTLASTIRRALVEATSPAPGPSAPTIRSEAFASKAVGPTLATAGVGLLAGDLLTVGAILRPDYATGPGLSAPLRTLHNVALCARLGIIARDPDALERLAEVDLFVLEDHLVLARTELDVVQIQTRLPEPILLRYAASAFRHLVDDRAAALVETCRVRRIHLLDLAPIDFGRGVTVAHDQHRIRVIEADPTAGPTAPLAVEIDGTVVGLIEFGPTDRLEAASAIDRIRRASHVPFALVSPFGEAESARLAKSLGVEMYRGDLSGDETAAFLAACRGRGLKVAFVGDCVANRRASAEAHVSISLVGEADLDTDPAGLLMLQARLGPLADLLAISRDHASRVVRAQRFILVPNLACVAGAFLFGFTGLTAVMLSNLGTLGLYRLASDSLRGLDSPSARRPGQPRRAG